MNYKLRLLTLVFTPLLGYACSIKAQVPGDLWSKPKKNLFIANASTEGPQIENFRTENQVLETERTLTGDRLLSEVRIRLQQRPYFQTRIQQQINYGKHKFLGVGHYYQQGQDRDRHVRLELQTKVGSTSGTLLQVSDGRIQWQDTTLPSKRTVTRLDLRRVRAIEKQTQKQLRLAPGSASSHLVQLNRSVQAGGIPALLKSLSENFTFSTPYHLQHENQSMYGIVGTWRAERLAVLLQGADHLTRQGAAKQELVKQFNEISGQQGTADGDARAGDARPHASQKITKEENQKNLAKLLLAIPAQMPTDVLLLIGQQDLFPYVIEYRRDSKKIAAVAQEVVGAKKEDEKPRVGFVPLAAEAYRLQSDPLSRIKFLQPKFKDKIDPRKFEYFPPSVSDVEYTFIDLTPTRRKR